MAGIIGIASKVLKPTGVMADGMMRATSAVIAGTAVTVAGATGRNPLEATNLLIDAPQLWWDAAKPALVTLVTVLVMMPGHFRTARRSAVRDSQPRGSAGSRRDGLK